MPLLGLTGQNVRAADALRLRALAGQSAVNLLDHVCRASVPPPVAADPWRTAPGLFGVAERDQLERAAGAHGLTMVVAVQTGVAPRTGRVACRVRWRDPVRGLSVEVEHARLRHEP